MACDKGIVLAFPGTGKTGKPVQLTQYIKLLPATGQQFMRIALMPHIKYDFIAGGGECPMHCHRKFDGAQIGGKMSSGFGNTFDQKRPDFFTQGRQLPGRKLLQILRAVDSFQQ